jgi:glutamate/tyrosine decarboxylase-like PLP-dependent enzyme
MANIVALTVARDVAAGETIAEDGLSGAPRLVAYCSDETHNSNDKAVALLGLGRRNLKKIATRPDYSIDIGALQAEIAADRAAGRVPFCVIGNCGTVNTGQIDDLPALRRLCDAERLWFHVDGAFGALLTLSDGLRHLAEGVQLGDSLAFDLHKWMNLPYDAACVLVRDGAAQARSFSPPASYLAKLDRGLAAGSHRFGQLGPDLSRGPRGIKVWLLIKAFGFRRFAQIVEQNVAQARHLASLIEAHPRLELVAPVATNVVCFRYRPEGMADRDLDAFNRELLMRIQESGVAAPSSTVLRGIFAIRLAIVNQRSRLHDFDGFVEDLLRMAEQI